MIVIALTVVRPALADVYFFGLQNVPININDTTGVYVDITQVGAVAVPTDPPLNWDINVTLAGGVVYNSPNVEMVRTTGGNTDSTNRILALAAGATVGSGQNYSYPYTYGASDGHTGVGAGYFNTGTPAYMGFRYMGSQYGWMEAVLNPNTSAGSLMNWAYETNGAAMTAGNITQDLVGSVSTVTMSGSDSHTLASVIANGGSYTTNLVKDGTGTWTLGAANTYTGGTTINQGTLALGANERLADTGAVNVNGGTFAMSTFNETVGAVTLTNGSITGTGTLTGTSYGVQNGNISANLAGSGVAMNKTTAGVVVLTGANTFTGATTISGGTLTAGAANALGGTSNVTIQTGGTLLLAGATTDHINDSATMTLAGGTFNTAGLSESAMGALSLTSSSIIDLANGASIIKFANSNGTWTGTLNIYNWTGIPVIGGGTDQLFFGSDTSGLTGTQLSQIAFYSGAGTGFLGGAEWANPTTGEVVPFSEVPEPGTWFVGALVAAALLTTQRQRLFARRVPALAAA